MTNRRTALYLAAMSARISAQLDAVEAGLAEVRELGEQIDRLLQSEEPPMPRTQVAQEREKERTLSS